MRNAMPNSFGSFPNTLQYPLLPSNPLVRCGSKALRFPPEQRGQVLLLLSRVVI